MSLVNEYKKQYGWRDWTKALSQCPVSSGQHILDLGCGPGDLSAELFKRGAIVTGVDGNSELLATAKERYPQCTFIQQDLNILNLAPGTFDGLWCSFVAAYFTDFGKIFSSWLKFLKKDAWVCIVEIDDLLGHEPLPDKAQQSIQDFYKHALHAGKHDFKTGKKIRRVLEENGFRVTQTELEDEELLFKGPASLEVKEAWLNRLNRMSGLKAFLGDEFTSFQNEFQRCLSSENHHSRCKVTCYVGIRQ